MVQIIRALREKILHGQLARDIVWLYVIYFLNYLVPLVMIPYLARVLGAKGWGVVAFALSFASLITLVSEFGFYMSGQREAARCRGDGQALSKLFSDVLSAKLLLACAIVPLSFALSRFIQMLKEDSWLMVGALFLGTMQGFNLGWYFRGIQRIKLAAGIEITAKGISVVLVIALISSPADSWKYFYALGASQFGALVLSLWFVSKEIKLRFPTISGGIAALSRGREIFLMHVTGSVFTTSNVFILGLLAPPQIVGYFAGAEKIARFLANAMDPVRHAMFPRLSNLIHHRRQEARRQVNRVLVATGVISVIMGGLVYLLSPALVTWVLGNDFSPAGKCLRVFALLIPILTLNAGFGFLWLLPRGFERASALILLGVFVTNIVLALLLVPIWGDMGMAAAVVTSELLVVISFGVFFIRDKHEQPL